MPMEARWRRKAPTSVAATLLQGESRLEGEALLPLLPQLLLARPWSRCARASASAAHTRLCPSGPRQSAFWQVGLQ